MVMIGHWIWISAGHLELASKDVDVVKSLRRTLYECHL